MNEYDDLTNEELIKLYNEYDDLIHGSNPCYNSKDVRVFLALERECVRREE